MGASANFRAPRSISFQNYARLDETLPPSVIIWTVGGAINHCESIGTENSNFFEVFTFQVNPLKRHLREK